MTDDCPTGGGCIVEGMADLMRDEVETVKKAVELDLICTHVGGNLAEGGPIKVPACWGSDIHNHDTQAT